MVKILRLTEGDLHRIIESSVRAILTEEDTLENYRKKFINVAYQIWEDPDSYKEHTRDIILLVNHLKHFGIQVNGSGLRPKNLQKLALKYEDSFEPIKKMINNLFATNARAVKDTDDKKPVESGEKKPNKDAVAKFFQSDRKKMIKKPHSVEEINKAEQIISPLIKKAIELYKKYGQYDVNGLLDRTIYELNRGLYEFTGKDSVGELPKPNTYSEEEYPDAKMAHDEMESFRINGLYKASRTMSTEPITEALKYGTIASDQISKVLSGHIMTAKEKNYAKQRELDRAKKIAGLEYAKTMKAMNDNNMQALQDMTM